LLFDGVYEQEYKGICKKKKHCKDKSMIECQTGLQKCVNLLCAAPLGSVSSSLNETVKIIDREFLSIGYTVKIGVKDIIMCLKIFPFFS